ncbi:hypothetical protein ACTJIJ_22685 [Niabella sp. 22666]|uniref:hypothetical protein n=1 Tax=Niabella sp. 22666 TaxID=3453954 RepID=UPI003F86FA23
MRLPIFILSTLLITSCGADEESSSTSPAVTEQPKAIQEEPAVPNGQGLTKGYQTISLYGNKLQFSVPDYFTEMSTAMKHSKYPGGNSPDVVYTDEEGTVNVAFKYTTTIIKSNDDLAKLSVEFAQPFQNKVEDLKSRTETINGSEFVVFEFMSQAIDTKVYNLMFLTELDGRMLLGTFNCTQALKGEWGERAKNILLSIRKGKK